MKLAHSRRSFLRAAGASVLTLPFLRALPGYAQADRQALVLTFKGNGVIRHTWGANRTGPGVGEYTFRSTLAPLAGFESQVTVVNGIRNRAAPLFGGTHEGGMRSLWTGNTPNHIGASIDQLLAARCLDAPRPSLELRVMSNEDELQRNDNTRMIFDAAGTPIDPLEDAEVAAQQLFGMLAPSSDDAAAAAQSALLGHLDAELSSLAPRLCNEDRMHLEALREGWERVRQSLTAGAGCSVPSLPAGGPSDFVDRSRQAIEVLSMALACGLTRVASLQWSMARSDLVASWLGVSGQHHDVSHNAPQPHQFAVFGQNFEYYEDQPRDSDLATHGAVFDQLNAIDTFYMGELAQLLTRLSDFPGMSGGTLLDEALVVFGSEIDNGSAHNHWNMPFLLAGGACGRLRRGQVVDYPLHNELVTERSDPPGARYHNDLLVTIARLMDCDLSSIGDPAHNQGPLSELLA